MFRSIFSTFRNPYYLLRIGFSASPHDFTGERHGKKRGEAFSQTHS
jgi:hypothetical protein